MTSPVIGSAFVEILSRTDRFEPGLKAGLAKSDRAVVQAGLNAGAAYARALGREILGGDFDGAMRRALSGARAEAERAGDDAGRGFLSELEAELSDVGVDVDARPRGFDDVDSQLPDGLDVAVRADPRGFDSIDAELPGDLEVEVAADLGPAQSELGELSGSGSKVGRDLGDSLVGGITDKIGILGSAGGPLVQAIAGAAAAVPLAGAGIAAALVGAITEGMDRELTEDRLRAATGFDEATVGRIGRAAGEAYVNNFGASFEDNLAAGGLLIQAGLADVGATQTELQGLIETAAGLADVFGGDVAPLIETVGRLLRTGLAGSAEEAFDVLTVGLQRSGGRADDLLETLGGSADNLRTFGFNAASATGLVVQGLDAGAESADQIIGLFEELVGNAADVDGFAESVGALGLNGRALAVEIGAGGERAAAGLDALLDALRATEDPLVRNTVLAELFGEEGSALQGVLLSLDPSQAIERLGGLEAIAGSAGEALGIAGDNASGSLASAQRAISVSTDAIKESLAAAFGPQISEWANTLTNDRERVLEVLLGITNGLFDAAEGVLGFAAGGIRAFGEFSGFVGETVDASLGFLDLLLQGLDAVLGPFDEIFGDKVQGARDGLAGIREDSADAFRSLEEGANTAAGVIDDTLIPGLQSIQDQFNESSVQALQEAAFSDAINNAAAQVEELGLRADGTRTSLQNLTSGVLDETIPAQQLLAGQLRTARDDLNAQAQAGIDAGRTQEELAGHYAGTRQALVEQLVQMGLTQQGAEDLLRTYGLTPGTISTTALTFGFVEGRAKARELQEALNAIQPFKRVVVQYDQVLGTTVRIPGQPGVVTSNAADGGFVSGPGGPRDDLLPFMLSNGEFVVNAAATAENRTLLEAINNGQSVNDVAELAPLSLNSGNGDLRALLAVAQQQTALLQAQVRATEEIPAGVGAALDGVTSRAATDRRTRVAGS